MAALLWSVLGLTFGAEPLLADVCDGDAPAAAEVAVMPHSDGATRIDGLVDAQGATETAVNAPAGPGDAGAPEHVVHVCHCTHAHGGTLAGGYAISVSTHAVADSLAWRPDRLPPSPALEPHLRPPVLLHAA